MFWFHAMTEYIYMPYQIESRFLFSDGGSRGGRVLYSTTLSCFFFTFIHSASLSPSFSVVFYDRMNMRNEEQSLVSTFYCWYCWKCEKPSHTKRCITTTTEMLCIPITTSTLLSISCVEMLLLLLLWICTSIQKNRCTSLLKTWCLILVSFHIVRIVIYWANETDTPNEWRRWRRNCVGDRGTLPYFHYISSSFHKCHFLRFYFLPFVVALLLLMPVNITSI